MSAEGRTTPATIAVEVRGLTKHFGSVLAVDHVDFSVHPGTVTGARRPTWRGLGP